MFVDFSVLSRPPLKVVHKDATHEKGMQGGACARQISYGALLYHFETMSYIELACDWLIDKSLVPISYVWIRASVQITAL